MDVYQPRARVLKVLAHPTRLRLLNALRGGEECVCHLTALLHQRQAYVSQQLMFLRHAGLIEDRKDGSRVYYRIKDPRAFQVLDAVDSLTGVRNTFLDSQILATCPCPKCQADGQKRDGRTRAAPASRKQKLA